MKLGSSLEAKSTEKIAINVGEQNSLKRKEEALRRFVDEIPITIEYGCHTIELRKDNRSSIFDGYSFYAHENDGDGIVIRIS